MKINSLYSNPQDINIRSYLQKCGVNDVDEYLKCKTVENPSNYKNIEQAKELILKYVGGDVGVK